MSRDVTTHALPPALAAAAEYVADQPDLQELQRALDAAMAAVQLADVQGRDSAWLQFSQREAGDIGVDAPQFSFGEAAFLYGLACAWVLFGGKGGAR